jgi:hypothetical protein
VRSRATLMGVRVLTRRYFGRPWRAWTEVFGGKKWLVQCEERLRRRADARVLARGWTVLRVFSPWLNRWEDLGNRRRARQTVQCWTGWVRVVVMANTARETARRSCGTAYVGAWKEVVREMRDRRGEGERRRKQRRVVWTKRHVGEWKRVALMEGHARSMAVRVAKKDAMARIKWYAGWRRVKRVATARGARKVQRALIERWLEFWEEERERRAVAYRQDRVKLAVMRDVKEHAERRRAKRHMVGSMQGKCQARLLGDWWASFSAVNALA